MTNSLKKLLSLFCCAAVLTSVLTACGEKAPAADENVGQQEAQDVSSENKTEDQSLFVYCGAGLKKPMEKLAKIYKEKTGVTIEYTYAGSGQLITQLQTSGKGDVFIIGSEQVYDKAKEDGLVSDYELVAHHTPCIGVPKGNEAKIEKIEDLARDGVKVILGDKEANAIGKTAAKIIKTNGLEAINKNVIATPATVNEIVTALKSKECDAAIVTKDSIFGIEDIETIEIDPEKNMDQIIPIGTCQVSEKKDLASDFVSFISSEKGKEVFAEFGFAPYEA